MLDNTDYAFPAGDESDGSSDEWDVGYASDSKKLEPEVSKATSFPPEDNVSVLKRAITAGDVDLVRQLLDSGMDVETYLGFEWTPLMCAVHVGHCELAELLLDRGASANFSRDHYTVLMAACTANSTTEENISKCVALLLSRNADPNVYNRSRMTCLMLAARDGYSQVINLLVSHGAELNFQNDSGHTALMLAVQYGHEAAVLKLLQLGADKSIKSKAGNTAADLAKSFKHLQLGADKSIKSKAGNTAADLAKSFKHLQICRILNSPSDSTVNGALPSKAETVFKLLNQNPEPLSVSKKRILKVVQFHIKPISQQICRILNSPSDSTVNGALPSKAETVFKLLNQNPEPLSVSKKSSAKLCDIELLLHGLNLEYLSDIMMENDITWSHLLTIEKEDLEKIGVTDPEDQKKILNAVQEIHLDRVDLDTLSQLDNIDSGSEELYNFLISLRQQCCYLTEMVQDVISRFPRSTSQLVLTWDPKKEAQAICTELVAQTGDLQKEVVCLRDLLSKLDPTDYTFHPPLPSSHSSMRRRVIKKLAVAVLGAGLLLLLSQARHFKAYV
ncbi:hypothetical protein PGIGA_G00225590 [Pangasianodon gigas]|uniref:Uncharacterized protein n=1 Tax=Pangasianodon gigas TaxID=30993 RepID=A0ACC5WJL7_PANGG|nr:hypothetical protein [Pangasianodon gigas]